MCRISMRKRRPMRASATEPLRPFGREAEEVRTALLRRREERRAVVLGAALPVDPAEAILDEELVLDRDARRRGDGRLPDAVGAPAHRDGAAALPVAEVRGLPAEHERV